MVTLDLVGFMMNGEDIKVKKKLGPYEHYYCVRIFRDLFFYVRLLLCFFIFKSPSFIRTLIYFLLFSGLFRLLFGFI